MSSLRRVGDTGRDEHDVDVSQITFAYDRAGTDNAQKGLVQEVTDETPSPNKVSSYSYDGLGRLTTEETKRDTSLNRRFTYSYEARDHAEQLDPHLRQHRPPGQPEPVSVCDWNPANNTDPTGRSCTAAAAAGAFAAGFLESQVILGELLAGKHTQSRRHRFRDVGCRRNSYGRCDVPGDRRRMYLG